MELKDFVAATLREIIEGVREAQAYVSEQRISARVNPVRESYRREADKRIVAKTRMRQTIEFDVAVTAEEGRETKAGAGVFVAAMGLGGHAKSDKSNQYAARVKFSVPIILPADGWEAEDVDPANWPTKR